MATARQRAISLKDKDLASFTINGRALSVTGFTFTHNENETSMAGIGVEITTQNGITEKTWSCDAVITEETFDAVFDFMASLKDFEIVISYNVKGTLKTLVFTGCNRGQFTGNMNADSTSTSTIQGTYKEFQRS